jgi:hypothetical protein
MKRETVYGGVAGFCIGILIFAIKTYDVDIVVLTSVAGMFYNLGTSLAYPFMGSLGRYPGMPNEPNIYMWLFMIPFYTISGLIAGSFFGEREY